MDILAIGEPLIEFSEIKNSKDGNIYLPGFGGDTSNFAIAAARQGASVGYQTKVGNDVFGKQFIDLWKSEGVDTSLVKIDETAHTGLYFISYTDKGHEFTYHRKGSAASKLQPKDILEDVIKDLKYLHISGISQAISDSSADTIFQAIEYAKKYNVKISYDPNLRLKLWPLSRAKAIIEATARISDVFMPSLEEAQLLSGEQEPKAIIDYFSEIGVRFTVLKVGKEGVYFGNKESKEKIDSFSVNTIDATGAGDCFDAAFISKLVGGATFKEAAVYANAAAALSTTNYGAVNGIPRREQVEDFLKEKVVQSEI